MVAMLQLMKKRGPASTGYAVCRHANGDLRMRLKIADANDPRDYGFTERLAKRRGMVEDRLRRAGASIDATEQSTEYAFLYNLGYDGDIKILADAVENVPGAEVLSLGHALEIVKDLGDARSVASQYHLEKVSGTHAIGHVRMATESDVDISGAHPYWAYPFSD